MGVPCIFAVEKRNTDAVFEEIARAGFSVTHVREAATCEEFNLRRGAVTVELRVHRPEEDVAEAFFETPYPPYTLRVWRWRAEHAAFHELTGIIDSRTREHSWTI